MVHDQKALLRDRLHHHRGSLILSIAAAVILIVVCMYAVYDGSALGGLEIWAFTAVNTLPDWLQPLFVLMTNIGTVGAIVIAGLIALITKHRRIGLAVMLSGGVAWYIADTLKNLIQRARPDGFIEDAIIRYTTLASGYGIPSGHAAVGAACAMALALIVPRKYAVWLILTAFVVGLSRVYLGVHLPLDVVAGWCIGIIVGYVVDFALRVERTSHVN